jgi:hypothetical protein
LLFKPIEDLCTKQRLIFVFHFFILRACLLVEANISLKLFYITPRLYALWGEQASFSTKAAEIVA